jgi:hypothetical protein
MPFITVVAEPPAQYVHRFNGPVIERVLPLAEARRACGRMGVWADGCAWTSRGKCYIVIPRGGPVRDLNAYRRHEIAHCNGWGHHGGSRTAHARAPYVAAAGGRAARQRAASPETAVQIDPRDY